MQDQWQIIKKGSSLKKFEVLLITNVLSTQLQKAKALSLICGDISDRLQAETGLRSWNVIIKNGDIGRITYSSQQYYLVCYNARLQLQAFIWLTKLVRQNQFQKSIVRQTQYF